MSKMEKEPLFSAKNLKYLTGPFSANNPVIVQILGICSALAVTVQLKPAIVMALSVTVVTAFSNLVMSLLRNGVPSRIRIIVQLVVLFDLRPDPLPADGADHRGLHHLGAPFAQQGLTGKIGG